MSRQITIPEDEIEVSAVRAQGAGGQNVNKVATAIHLRFDIHASSLPVEIKRALLDLPDRRISSDGVVIIKAQRFRTQDKNRADALLRLQALVQRAGEKPKKRVPTKPSRRARERRLNAKSRRGRVKALRGRVTGEEA